MRNHYVKGRRGRGRLVSCALVGVLALTGCGAMPRSGPVHKVLEPTAQAQEQQLRYSPQAPQPGATAQEIVEGFLAAGVGAQDDYGVARQYLTPQLANTWTPNARVLVHTGDPTTGARLEDGGFRTSVEVSAELSSTGVLRQQPQGTARVLDFSLTSVDGQWRISRAPDGVIVSESDFAQIFTPHNLYFFDRSREHLVPDPRWFAERSTVPTAVVRALLAGPASYLDGAVTSTIPRGATLARSAVPVSGGSAEVDLTMADFDPASVDAARRMEQQLEASLRLVSDVKDVQLRINDAPVEASGSGVADPVIDVTVPNRQIGVSEDQLAFYQGGQTEPIPNLSLPAGALISKPGMDMGMNNYGWVDPQRDAVFTVREGQAPVERWSGSQLTRPSFDRHGRVWGAGADGTVHAARVATGEEGSAVSAPWLADHTVRSLQVSRDGARVLVVTSQASGATSNVWVAGVVRDDTGQPTEIDQGNLVVADVDANTAKWISDTEFVTTARGGRDNHRPTLYTVAGTKEALPALNGVTSLAGGNGRSSIYGVADGNLYLLTGNSWALQSDQVSDTAFAG